MTYDGRAIANSVLDLAEESGISLSNLALQKVIFFCHAWNLVDTGEPLVKNDFEAWEHGPVLQYIYRQFRDFEKSAVRGRAKGLNSYTGKQEIISAILPQDILDRIRRVVAFYGRLNPWDLVELTHIKNGPWDKVWNHEGKVNPGMKISNADIINFYSKAAPEFRSQ